MRAYVRRDDVLPLASEHGGSIFRNVDGVGIVWELHTLFLPDGWGREVVWFARQALEHLFSKGAQVIFTFEEGGLWRSAPPRSHGWKGAADYAPTVFGDLKSWVLTRNAWENSPVGMKCR